MRSFLPALFACWLVPAIASAQAQGAAPVASTPDAPAAVPDAQATPAPQASQPAAAPAAEEPTRSLFDQTWRQVQIGGRFTSVDGDQARFQRYQDLRDGLLLTDFRYANADAAGNWLYRLTADNVGYRDQRFSGVYQRTGRLVISGLWDEI